MGACRARKIVRWELNIIIFVSKKVGARQGVICKLLGGKVWLCIAGLEVDNAVKLSLQAD